ncbi:MAG: type IV secretion system protein [Candidatus Azambacteria bacterium]|nr:type IV secretion system protein [Candidatus Azambacteria bacterium]
MMKCYNIAHKILKKKRGVLLVLLFVVAGFVFSAQGAAAGGECNIWLADFGGCINSLLLLVLGGLATILSYIAMITNWAMQPAPITSSYFVQEGWKATRDLANMLFILILLAIALSFILYDSFGVKRALPKLLLIALLINFSIPIAGVALDFANVVTSFFLAEVSKGGFTENVAQSVGLSKVFNANNFISGADNLNVDKVGGNSFINILFAVGMVIGMIFIFLALAFMFLIRTGYISVLLILLPIALVLSAFPPTSKHFSKWMSKFMQWTMFAPAAAFFLYLSMLVLTATNASGKSSILEMGGGTAPDSFAFTLLRYIMAWGLMLMSLTVAQSMGITGASTATAMWSKGTKWARGKAYGAGTRGLAAATRRSGLIGGEAGEKGLLNRGAEYIAKHPIAFAGLGKLGLESGLRAAAVKATAAVAAREGLTAKEKESYMGMSDSMRAGEEKRLKATRLVPGASAKLAHLQAIIAQKGKLNVLTTTGNIDPEETSIRIKEAHENAMKHGLKKVADEIKYSNTSVGLEIELEEWEKKATKQELEGVIRDASGRMIAATVKATGKTLEDALKDFKYISTDQMKAAKGTWTEKSMAIMAEIGAIDSSYLRKAVDVGDLQAVSLYNSYLKNLGEGAEGEVKKKVGVFKELLRKHNPGALSGLASGNFIRFGVEAPPELLTDAGKKKQKGEWGITDAAEPTS